VNAEFRFADAASTAILAQACKALDRAADCETRIAADGPVITTKSGPRDHPLLRHELMARGLACRLLIRLGIVNEPSKPLGRPAGQRFPGISWDKLDADR
jgi:hypothetical protein